MNNPFDIGNVVSPERFIPPVIPPNKKLIETIKNRIASRDNIAIVGEPRFGKTSLLYYLKSQSVVKEINQRGSWICQFQYIDAQMFKNKDLTQERFWRYALSPVNSVITVNPTHPIAKYYRDCEDEKFDIFSLEQLFTEMAKYKARLVLMIDEFDALLSHPELGAEEFFGNLRSLSTRMETLMLLIASRLDIAELHKRKQFQQKFGSPYFNYFVEFSLGPFSDSLTQKLLDRCAKFREQDKQFLVYISGRHPFFLQAAAHALWDAYENNYDHRLTYVAKQLYKWADPALDDTWQHWSPTMRKALVIITLDGMPKALAGRNFDFGKLQQSLPGYSKELQRLEQCGFIMKAQGSRTGWKILPQVLAWWLIDCLLAAYQENEDIGEFLKQHEMTGIFNSVEKTQFAKAVIELGRLTKLGVESFIKSAAEGFAKGLTT